MALIDLRPQSDYMHIERVELDSRQPYPDILKKVVDAVRDGRDLVPALDSTIKKLGFQSFMYGFSTAARPNVESKMWTFTTLPTEWVRDYERNAYIEVDPRVQGLFKSPLPVIWDQRLLGQDPRLTAFLRAAGRYGTRSGISFYLPDSGEYNYMVAFNSTTAIVSDSVRGSWMKQQGDLMIFGVYFHALLMKPLIAKGLAPSSQGAPLSAREIETLGLLVHGLTHDQVGARMGITSRTVQAHADSIRSKLNARNISEAVYLATKAGLLRTDPARASASPA